MSDNRDKNKIKELRSLGFMSSKMETIYVEYHQNEDEQCCDIRFFGKFPSTKTGICKCWITELLKLRKELDSKQ